MPKEQTSSKISNIASRILNDGKFSIKELKALAASALTQDEIGNKSSRR